MKARSKVVNLGMGNGTEACGGWEVCPSYRARRKTKIKKGYNLESAARPKDVIPRMERE